MQISLLTDLFQAEPIEAALDKVAEAGFTSIELNGIPYWEPHITFFESQLGQVARYRALLKSRGLALATICVQPDLVVLDEEESEQWLTYCLNAIAFGQALEAKSLSLIFSGNPFFDIQEQTDVLYSALKRMDDETRKTGLQIAVEIHPGSFVKTTPDAVALIRQYALETVGYLFCTPHIATYCAEDIIEAFNASKDIVNHIHFADTPLSLHNHRHMAPGHGDLDMKKLRDTIAQSGYDGTMSLQIYSEALDKVAVARAAREFLEAGFLQK